MPKSNRSSTNGEKTIQTALRTLSYISGDISSSSELTFAHAFTHLSPSEQASFQKLFSSWLSIQEEEIREILNTLVAIFKRLDYKKKGVAERVASHEYIQLIKRGFRNCSTVESEEKRTLIQNLMVNAATIRLSPDYTLEMFIKWIGEYSDVHFEVIRLIADKPGITRKEIWLTFNDTIPAEDSAASDMYRLLILDLSTGHLIRQRREKDFAGSFVRKRPRKREAADSPTLISSAFDDEKEYVLTELGEHFVRYTMS